MTETEILTAVAKRIQALTGVSWPYACHQAKQAIQEMQR